MAGRDRAGRRWGGGRRGGTGRGGCGTGICGGEGEGEGGAREGIGAREGGGARESSGARLRATAHGRVAAHARAAEAPGRMAVRGRAEAGARCRRHQLAFQSLSKESIRVCRPALKNSALFNSSSSSLSPLGKFKRILVNRQRKKEPERKARYYLLKTKIANA